MDDYLKNIQDFNPFNQEKDAETVNWFLNIFLKHFVVNLLIFTFGITIGVSVGVLACYAIFKASQGRKQDVKKLSDLVSKIQG